MENKRESVLNIKGPWLNPDWDPCFGFVLQAWGELALLRLLLAHGAQVSSVKRGTRSIWCRKIVTAPYRTH